MTSLSAQIEVCRLKKELAEKESQLSIKPAEKAVDDELSWLNTLSHETSENVQERINLQKAIYELEETNLRNRTELQHLDDAIAKQQVREVHLFSNNEEKSLIHVNSFSGRSFAPHGFCRAVIKVHLIGHVLKEKKTVYSFNRVGVGWGRDWS